MPTKFKESMTVVVDRKKKQYKTVNYFMSGVSTKELLAALESTSTLPKKKNKIRNELVKRNVI